MLYMILNGLIEKQWGLRGRLIAEMLGLCYYPSAVLGDKART